MSNIKIESDKALEVITSFIKRCEKAQLKFNAGTSQHTLLKNRLNALHISKALLFQEDTEYIGNHDLKSALTPIASIISKCKKAQDKYSEDSVQYKQYINLIDAMILAEMAIINEINKRNIK